MIGLTKLYSIRVTNPELQMNRRFPVAPMMESGGRNEWPIESSKLPRFQAVSYFAEESVLKLPLAMRPGFDDGGRGALVLLLANRSFGALAIGSQFNRPYSVAPFREARAPLRPQPSVPCYRGLPA